MEIACLVTVKKPATLQSTKLAEKYFKLVKEKYIEPKNEEILGHFVRNIGTGVTQKTVGKESRKSTILPKNNPNKWILKKCSLPNNVLNRTKTFLKLLKLFINFYRRAFAFFILFL